MALRISNRAYALATGSVVISGASAKLLEDDRIQAAYLGGRGLRARENLRVAQSRLDSSKRRHLHS